MKVSLEVLSSPGDPAVGRRLPPWLKRPLPSGDFSKTRRVVADCGVATVCQQARCPNLSECWSKRHTAFMILGEKCTRRCHYCAVTTAKPEPPEADEPKRIGQASRELGLTHVVLTAVARDDLQDEGAGHFAQCVLAIHDQCPGATVEVLPADFHARPECIELLCDASPELYNHNLEMVERLTPAIRPQGDYRRSLEVLRIAKAHAPGIITKSGLMVGLGETTEELHRALDDLREVGCDVLTIGQYLRPSSSLHWPVKKYYRPEEFDELAELADRLGFLSVAAGAFVRSSYNAESVFAEGLRRAREHDSDRRS